MPCIVFLWLYVCLVFCFVFVFLAIIKAATLRSIVPRYPCASAATRSYLTTVCVLFCLIHWEVTLFPGILYHYRFLLVWRVPCTFSFRMVFFYLVTTGWILTIQSISQLKKDGIVYCTVCTVCMVITYSKSKDQPGKAANPARGQLNRENEYFPVPVCA